MGCLYGIPDPMDMSLSKLWEMVKGKEVWQTAVHEIAKSQTRLRQDGKDKLKSKLKL